MSTSDSNQTAPAADIGSQSAPDEQPAPQAEQPPADTSWATMEQIRKARERDYERR